MIDIINKKCLECDTRPFYGFPTDKSPSYCNNHKKDGMVDIVSKRCLECETRPYYGFPTDKSPSYSINHKKDGMIDIKNKKCKSNEQNIICEQQASQKYKGFCARCYAYLFPNDPINTKYSK